MSQQSRRDISITVDNVSKTTAPPKNDVAAAGGDTSKLATQDKVLSASANLAQLLPTGSVMAYQALSPSFNNHGECYTSNWWLTVSLVTFLTVFCIFFAFTDSIIHNGKVYYGVAMKGGLRIFNKEDDDPNFAVAHAQNSTDGQGQPMKQNPSWWSSIFKDKKPPVKTDYGDLTPELNTLKEELRKRKLHWLDGVHAFFTAVVFLSVAFSDVGLQKCLFPHAGKDTMELLKNMPLGMSFLSSFVFMIFPTTRHGIGFHGSADSTDPNPSNSKVRDLKTEEEKQKRDDSGASSGTAYHHDIELAEQTRPTAAKFFENPYWYGK